MLIIEDNLQKIARQGKYGSGKYRRYACASGRRPAATIFFSSLLPEVIIVHIADSGTTCGA